MKFRNGFEPPSEELPPQLRDVLPLRSLEDVFRHAQVVIRAATDIPLSSLKRGAIPLRWFTPEARRCVVDQLAADQLHLLDQGLAVELEPVASLVLKQSALFRRQPFGEVAYYDSNLEPANIRLSGGPEEFGSTLLMLDLRRRFPNMTSVGNEIAEHDSESARPEPLTAGAVKDASAVRSKEVASPLKSSPTKKRQELEALRSHADAMLTKKRRSPYARALVTPLELERLELDEKDEKILLCKPYLTQLLTAPVRVLPRATLGQIARLDALTVRFPNFLSVIDIIKQELRLRHAGRASAGFSPLLMVGPPGIGKTAFSEALARAIDHEEARVNVGGVSAGFVLKGNSASWSRSGPGVIAKSALRLARGKGLLVSLDEVDKGLGDLRYPVEPALLELLEPNQLARFKDECLDVELNLVGICSFLGSANDLRTMSMPLRSRFQIVTVQPPTAEQMPALVRSVDQELRRQNPYLSKLFEPMSEDVIRQLTRQTPRELRRLLMTLYASGLTVHATSKRTRRALTVFEVARQLADRRSRERLPATPGLMPELV